jgi:WhiB family redox-sensing transcriptional regulator
MTTYRTEDRAALIAGLRTWSRCTAIGLERLRDEVLDGAECLHDPYLHTGPDVFEHEPKAEREIRETVAREVCDGCTVIGACLEYALRTRPASGVWAGLTAAELADLADAPESSQPAGAVA